MPYKLRFVQRFDAKRENAFLSLEEKFAKLEKRRPDFPKGRRFRPLSGREAGNTLIWECEFPSLQKIEEALHFLSQDKEHETLFQKQVGFFRESHTEIYEVLEFSK